MLSGKKKATHTMETNHEIFFFFFNSRLGNFSRIPRWQKKRAIHVHFIKEVSILPWLSKHRQNNTPPLPANSNPPALHAFDVTVPSGLTNPWIATSYFSISLAPASIYIQMLSICHIQYVSKPTRCLVFSFSLGKRQQVGRQTNTCRTLALGPPKLILSA